jgi:hypothetical protein
MRSTSNMLALANSESRREVGAHKTNLTCHFLLKCLCQFCEVRGHVFVLGMSPLSTIVLLWNCSDSVVLWNCSDSVVLWNCSDSVVLWTVPTVWYFGTVPTVWYFGTVPTVWYCGTVPTVWYFGTVPTVWYCCFVFHVIIIYDNQLIPSFVLSRFV